MGEAHSFVGLGLSTSTKPDEAHSAVRLGLSTSTSSNRVEWGRIFLAHAKFAFVREVFFWKGSTAFALFAFFAAKPVRIHSVYSVVELKMVAPYVVGCATSKIQLSKIK